jgi:hypothetical protein
VLLLSVVVVVVVVTVVVGVVVGALLILIITLLFREIHIQLLSVVVELPEQVMVLVEE